MVKEFEGKTEKEAIDTAISTLGLNRDEFDVEIVEAQKEGFLFKKGRVLIRVHYDKNNQEASDHPETDLEHGIIDFLTHTLDKMGFPGTVSIAFREDSKIGLQIDSEHTAILIGKQGKNLDALQLLVNVVAGRLGDEDLKVILDIEHYRMRREESLMRMARKVAEQVQRTKGSKLLEPMNPFERRLIHTTLNKLDNIDTKSEGEGLYKQVRIYYRGVD